MISVAGFWCKGKVWLFSFKNSLRYVKKYLKKLIKYVYWIDRKSLYKLGAYRNRLSCIFEKT